jgi:hypothetical protein
MGADIVYGNSCLFHAHKRINLDITEYGLVRDGYNPELVFGYRRTGIICICFFLVIPAL